MRSGLRSLLQFEWNQRHGTRARASGPSSTPQAWWLDDYALFRAIHDRESNRAWTEWPEPLKRRDPDALERRSPASLERDVLLLPVPPVAGRRAVARRPGGRPRRRRRVCSAICHSWSTATARTSGCTRSDFHLDVSVGVPPDAFSATGQDWGMPALRWDTIAPRIFVAARARPAQRGSLRRLSRRPPRRLLPHLRASAGRGSRSSPQPTKPHR